MAQNINVGKNYPPMPKPEDFGVSPITLLAVSLGREKDRYSGYCGAKLRLYEEALQSWKEAVREISGDKHQE